MTEWRDYAACVEVDTDLFFPEQGDAGQVALAKTVCSRCLVRSECLEEQLSKTNSRQYDHGVWGGTSPLERERIRRARRELKGVA